MLPLSVASGGARSILAGEKTLKIKPKTDAEELEVRGLYVTAQMSF